MLNNSHSIIMNINLPDPIHPLDIININSSTIIAQKTQRIPLMESQ